MGPHELATDWMVGGLELCGGESFASVDEEVVEHGFGDAVRAAMLASNHAHSIVGVAGQTGLVEGCVFDPTERA